MNVSAAPKPTNTGGYQRSDSASSMDSAQIEPGALGLSIHALSKPTKVSIPRSCQIGQLDVEDTRLARLPRSSNGATALDGSYSPCRSELPELKSAKPCHSSSAGQTDRTSVLVLPASPISKYPDHGACYGGDIGECAHELDRNASSPYDCDYDCGVIDECVVRMDRLRDRAERSYCGCCHCPTLTLGQRKSMPGANE